MYIHVPHACLVPLEVKGGVGTPGAEGTNSCESHGCWKANLGLLQILLAAEPSLPAAQDIPELEILLAQPPTEITALCHHTWLFFTVGTFHQGC